MTIRQSDADYARSVLASEFSVSRETLAQLDLFVDLLLHWQARINLISPDTISELWTRHVLDSAQIVAHLPKAEMICDLGSGAGFPGIVVSCLADRRFGTILIEKSAKKSAFLREAIRLLDLNARVETSRIEECLPMLAGDVSVITARALAPLPELLALAEPAFIKGAEAVFHKGKTAHAELTEARQSWMIDMRLEPSRSADEGVLVCIKQAKRYPVAGTVS
ncbi:MAG: 16S rRNA (guanine(527)-N(7))-methyltransferase RsmG [Pseudomonadota bacterium]